MSWSRLSDRQKVMVMVVALAGAYVAYRLYSDYRNQTTSAANAATTPTVAAPKQRIVKVPGKSDTRVVVVRGYPAQRRQHHRGYTHRPRDHRRHRQGAKNLPDEHAPANQSGGPDAVAARSMTHPDVPSAQG